MPVVFDENTARRILAAVQAIEKLRGPGIRNTPGSLQIDIPQGGGDTIQQRRSGVPTACLMVQTGGADGTASAAATWTYKVTDLSGNVLNASDVTPIDPTASPHKFQRTNGTTLKATAGLYIYDASGKFAIWWCNEWPKRSAC